MYTHPQRQAAYVRAQAQAYTDLAGEISAGKYKMSMDAREARAKKVREAIEKVREKK